MKRFFLAGLVGLALASCVTPAPAAQRYSGEFVWGFEMSSFRSDDGRGPYWLSSEADAWAQIVAPIEQEGRGPWGRVHLVVEGRLSGAGHYGQLGAYEHELRVTRVIASGLIGPEAQGS